MVEIALITMKGMLASWFFMFLKQLYLCLPCRRLRAKDNFIVSLWSPPRGYRLLPMLSVGYREKRSTYENSTSG